MCDKKCAICGEYFTPTKYHKKWCEQCYETVHKEVECVICGSKFKQKYQNEKCCSKKCAAIMRGNFKNKEILDKIKGTNIDRYGVSNPFNNQEIQRKANKNNTRIAQKEKLKIICNEKFKESRQHKMVTKNKQSKKAAIMLDTFKKSTIDYIRDVQTEKTFEDCIFKSKLRFDFYFPTAETPFVIEYDGEQHYHPVRFNKITDEQMYQNFISTQVKDWYKDFYCITHNIPLIRVKYITNANPNYEQIYDNCYIIWRAQGSDKIIDVFDVNESDFVNYKQATFNILSGISCTFKCGNDLCQNSELIKQKIIQCDIDDLINKYLSQNIAHSITFQGLETLDNLKQLLWFIYYLRKVCQDPLIIWTGYTKSECKDFIYIINKMNLTNIIIKFGRFIPNQETHFDEVLGVSLASDNQYGNKIS